MKGGKVKAGGRILDGDLVEATTMTEVSLFKKLEMPVWKLLYFDCKKAIHKNISRQIEPMVNKGISPFMVTSSLSAGYPKEYLFYDIDELVHNIYAIKQPTILLVRPDNYVAVRTSIDNFERISNYLTDRDKLRKEI
jgi:hypothetical protein